MGTYLFTNKEDYSENSTKEVKIINKLLFLAAIALVSALLISPAMAGEYGTVIYPGETVFIGESGLDISNIDILDTNTTVTSTIAIDLSAGDTWDNYLQLTYSGSIDGGTADSWDWNFGDESGTSSGQSGTYTYSETGSYTVSLTVASSDSELTDDTLSQVIVIGEPDFEASADIEMSETSLLIDYESTTEGAVSWDWDFGDDDGTSTYESGSYSYDDTGTYQITLTATSPAGDTDTYTEYITFSDEPEAYFTADKTTGGAPLYVEFTDDSEENPYTDADIVEWYWEFDDDDDSYYHAYEEEDDDPDTSFTFDEEGTYTVTLTVTDENGEDDTYEMDIVVDDDIAPKADFSVDDGYDTVGCAPLTVAFIDESDESGDTGADIIAWYWTVYDEDGNKYDYSTSQNPYFTFEEVGKYTISLTVTDDNDISDTEIKTDYTEVTLNLSASFSASPTSGGLPLTVNFYALDGNDNDYNIEYYNWDFGDGTVYLGTDDSPSHVYVTTGAYDVKLTVIDEKDNRYTYEIDNYITVIATPEPTPGSHYFNESIILYSGWNFISTPKRLDPSGGNNTAGKLFKDVDSGGHSALMYNGSSEKWEAVKADTIIKPLDSLWIYSNSTENVDISLTLDSNPLQAPPSKYLSSGWNTLGYSSTESATAKNTLIDVSDKWTKAIGWNATIQNFEYTIINGGSGTYSDSRYMFPGKGYWLWMKEEGTIASLAINSEEV